MVDQSLVRVSSIDRSIDETTSSTACCPVNGWLDLQSIDARVASSTVRTLCLSVAITRISQQLMHLVNVHGTSAITAYSDLAFPLLQVAVKNYSGWHPGL